MRRESVKGFIFVGIFAVEIVFIETLIVVSLRMFYYPAGFVFGCCDLL